MFRFNRVFSYYRTVLKLPWQKWRVAYMNCTTGKERKSHTHPHSGPCFLHELHRTFSIIVAGWSVTASFRRTITHRVCLVSNVSFLVQIHSQKAETMNVFMTVVSDPAKWFHWSQLHAKRILLVEFHDRSLQLSTTLHWHSDRM